MTGAELLQCGTAFTLCMVPPIIVMHLLVKLLIVTVQLLAITGVLNLNNYTYQLIYETIIYIFFLNECLHAQVSFCKILNLKTNPNVTVCEYNRKKC